VVLLHPSRPLAPEAPVEQFDAPDDLTPDERAIWTRQAPHAFRLGTLTEASAFAFQRYCKVAAAEHIVSKGSAAGGTHHRGLLQHLNALELQFRLTPDGRPVVRVVSEPPSKLDRFRRPTDPLPPS